MVKLSEVKCNFVNQLLGNAKHTHVYVYCQKCKSQFFKIFLHFRGQSYKTVYTIGRCKIKSLNCCLNDKEKCNLANMLGCCVPQVTRQVYNQIIHLNKKCSEEVFHHRNRPHLITLLNQK